MRIWLPFGKSKDLLKVSKFVQNQPVLHHLDRPNPYDPFAFVVGWPVSYWINTHAIMCKCGDVRNMKSANYLHLQMEKFGLCVGFITLPNIFSVCVQGPVYDMEKCNVDKFNFPYEKSWFVFFVWFTTFWLQFLDCT